MEKLIAALLSLMISTLTIPDHYKPDLVVDGHPLRLTFEDEFNGQELDSTKWVRADEMKRQDKENYWSDSMTRLNGKGQLVLSARTDRDTGNILTGAVWTKGLFEQSYGYFEICTTLNTVPGYWTAFWLITDNVMSEENGGRDGTEIDVYESAYHDEGLVQHTLHWDGYTEKHRSEGSHAPLVYDKEYHTFGVLWTPEEYVFYVDGNETWRTDAAAAGGTCEVPLYMIISAETGSWTYSQLDKNSLRDRIMIEYVRAYSLMEQQ